MRNEAIAYATLGWWIFRCKPRDKWPLAPKCSRGGHEHCDGSCGELGHGLYDATAEVGIVAGWWDQKPNANIGLRCGRVSSVFVLDVDVKAPESRKAGVVCLTGPEALARVEAIHGALPETRESRTGSGGRQLFFRYPADRNVGSPKTLRLPTGEMCGIDVRGDGGIAILPPSIHPNGTPYTWIRDVDPVDAPAWLLDWVSPPAVERPAYVPPVRSFAPGRAEIRYAEVSLDNAARTVATAPEKQRHDTIYNQARIMGGYLAGGFVLGEDEVVEALTSAGLAAYGGKDERVTATVRAGLENGKASPLQWPPESFRGNIVPVATEPPPFLDDVPLPDDDYAPIDDEPAERPGGAVVPLRPPARGGAQAALAVAPEPVARAARKRKPVIQIKQQPEVVEREAWGAVKQYNATIEAPYFKLGGLVCRLNRSERSTVIEKCTPEDVLKLLWSAADWMSLRKANGMDTNAQGGMVEIDAEPPPKLAGVMRGSPPAWLPVIEQVTYAPTFGPAGDLYGEPGFHAAARRWYEDSGRPVNPVRLTSAEAVATLRDWMADFPFADDAGFAHAVGMFLLPFVRDMIKGPTPCHLFSAPTPGTGKSLLCELIAKASTGVDVPLATFPDREEEVEKKIAAMLYAGSPVIIFDNVDQHLRSPSFAQALTASSFTGRVLGFSTMQPAPIRAVWALTANGMTAKADLVRRTVRIHLVRIEPFDKSKAVHPNIQQWTEDNRDRLISAALKLVYDWIGRGRPESAQTLPSYERWAEVIGGILDVAGIPGFLAGRKEWAELADPESAEWARFVTAWAGRFGFDNDNVVSTKDLLELADNLEVLGNITAQSTGDLGRVSKFGKALSKRADAVISGYQLIHRNSTVRGYALRTPRRGR